MLSIKLSSFLSICGKLTSFAQWQMCLSDLCTEDQLRWKYCLKEKTKNCYRNRLLKEFEEDITQVNENSTLVRTWIKLRDLDAINRCKKHLHGSKRKFHFPSGSVWGRKSTNKASIVTTILEITSQTATQNGRIRPAMFNLGPLSMKWSRNVLWVRFKTACPYSHATVSSKM